MSSEQATGGPSRHTNENKSVNAATADSTDHAANDDLPTPADRLEEFRREYPDRAKLQLTQADDQQIRRDYCHEEFESWTADAPTEDEDAVSGQDLVRRTAYTWERAVAQCLEDHADTRRTTINLECGRPSDPEHAEFSIDAETRWFSSYQRRYFAQMKAWLRELCGGERPSGGTVEPSFDDPHIALITLSASSVPGGERVGPLDHLRVRRDSWQDCYHTMRNTLRSLGLSWQYDRRTEPHHGERGGGLNHCYGHDHIVLVVDGDVSAADLRPIVEKHVDSCEWAGASAHDLDEDWRADPDAVNTVTVKAAGELDNLANYVASYCGIEPVDLLDRSLEYIAWAAAVTAANKRTVSRSDDARHAAQADACKQRYESDAADQSRDHGERVVTSTSRGYDVECIECGSPHGIDQSRDPMTAATSDGPVAADGGLEDDRRAQLEESWQDARAAATVGEYPTRSRRRREIEEYMNHNPDASPAQILGDLGLPPDARDLIAEIDAGIDPSESTGFDRGPEWRVKSVTVGEEEFPASAGDGVDMVSTEMPVERLLSESYLLSNFEKHWRFERTNVSTGGSRNMAAKLVSHGITDPYVADRVIDEKLGRLEYDLPDRSWYS